MIKGTAPVLSVAVDGATNHIWAAYQYDLNGNQTATNNQTLAYDYDNRISILDNRNGTGNRYGYDPDNRRVYSANWTGDYNTISNETVYFFRIRGQRMAAYSMTTVVSPPSVSSALVNDRVYFGGKLIRGDAGQWMTQDRWQSVGKFFLYGEDRGGSMFATYTRDASGLDYAVNRYYWSNLGRFTSPDPYKASGGPGDPGSWNRCAYVGGDPVDFRDPSGLNECAPDDNCVDVVDMIDSLEYLKFWSFGSPRFTGGGGGAGGRPRKPDPPPVPELPEDTPMGWQKKFAAAFRDASKRLDKEKCANLFGGKAQALAALNGADYNLGLSATLTDHQTEMLEQPRSVIPRYSSTDMVRL